MVRFDHYPLTFEIELDEPYTVRSLVIRPASKQIAPDDPYTFSSSSLYGPMRILRKCVSRQKSMENGVRLLRVILTVRIVPGSDSP